MNPRGEDWCLQGLAVRVAPPIIVRSKNRRDLVWLYYKEPELTSDAARIANRILQLSRRVWARQCRIAPGYSTRPADLVAAAPQDTVNSR